jgi:hypothetical protein
VCVEVEQGGAKNEQCNSDPDNDDARYFWSINAGLWIDL